MARSKIANINQQRKLEEIRKNYPWLKIISHEQFVQLFHRDIFPVSNYPRLYKQVQNNFEDFLNSFHYAFNKLPLSYQDKIILGRNFNSFLNGLLEHLESVAKTKKNNKNLDLDEKSGQDFSYQVYQKLFNIGLKGLIRTMPSEFEPYLKSQIKPLLLLMLSIARFSKSVDPNMMPNLDFPTFLFDDRELSTINY